VRGIVSSSSFRERCRLSPRLGSLDAVLDIEGDLEKLPQLDPVEIVDVVSDMGLDTTDIIL